MFKIGSIIKLAKGGMGPDEFAEILDQAGIEADTATVTKEDAEAAFERLVVASQTDGAETTRVEVTLKNEIKGFAIIVFQAGRGSKPSLKILS